MTTGRLRSGASDGSLPGPTRLCVGPDFELWVFDLHLQPGMDTQACLSQDESHRAARFVFERDRRRYLAAHCMLRQLLSRRTAIPAARLEFSEGPFGKPALRNLAPCAFNFSHSEDVAVLLMAAKGDIGVDVELLRPMPDAQELAERNFSPAECASLRSLDATHRDAAFLTGWTRKEACLKAIGSGLSIAPHTFTVGLDHVPCTACIETRDGQVAVQVQSFCHEQRLLVAYAKLVTRLTG